MFNYYALIDSGEVSAIKGNNEIAEQYFLRAFEIFSRGFLIDYFSAASNSALIDNNDKQVSEFLICSILSGLTKKELKNNQVFNHNLNKSTLRKLLISYDSLHQIYLSRIDEDLSLSIKKMIRRDQRTRGILGVLSGSKRMKEIDNENFDKLSEIIDKHGWPGISLIGENWSKSKYNVSSSISLMLLHFSRDQINFLRSCLMSAVFQGEMYPYHYARVIDYKFIPIHLKQYYGTYNNTSGELIEVDDSENVNQRRAEIGLESIERFILKIHKK